MIVSYSKKKIWHLKVLCLFSVLNLVQAGAQNNGLAQKANTGEATYRVNEIECPGKKSSGEIQAASLKHSGIAAVFSERFELPGDDGYSAGGKSYEVSELRTELPLKPYRHIRKLGETGCFHFAKDYDALKHLTEPEVVEAQIIFSATPFSSAHFIASSKFSSSAGAIYARLSTGNRTLKEALQISGELFRLSVDIYVYAEGSDELKSWRQQSTLYLSADQVNQRVLDFDIKPSVDRITGYYSSKDKYSFYVSPFPQIHNQQFFPTSGTYKIAIRLGSEVKNDWGEFSGNRVEVMGWFEYIFQVKDARNVFEEGQQVLKKLQEGMRKLPSLVTPIWKQVSSPSIVTGYSQARYEQLYTNYYKDVKIIKTVLAAPGGVSWKIVSNDNLIPTYKYCTQTVYFFVKDSEGNCYYHPCELRQDYAGGGRYGPVHLAVFDDERIYVKCEELR